MRRRIERLAVVMLVVACDRRPHVSGCQSDLSGVWTAASGERWMILDQGPASLEVYPLFPDAVPAHDVIAAPRVIELHREGSGLAGTIEKRYMLAMDTCQARVPVRVASCSDDTLELMLADVEPPLTMAPCSWPAPKPPHAEHWYRK